MKNPFRNPFFVAFLAMVAVFAAVVWSSHFVVGLFVGSGTTAWLIILGTLVIILILMRFRKMPTPHEAQDSLLRALETPDLRAAREDQERAESATPSQ